MNAITTLIAAGLVATATLAALMTSAAAQTSTRSYYNSQGSFAGQSFQRGNSTSFSDGQGRFSGSAIRHGKSRPRSMTLAVATSARVSTPGHDDESPL